MRTSLRRWARGASAAVLLLSTAGSTWAAKEENLTTRVDAVFEEYTKAGSPGCAVGVIQDGRLVQRKGYGLANLEHEVPITPQTVFDIGSTAKQFTAASVLLLAQDGKLSLDDDVRKLVPEIPDYGTPATIRHLLHHTSGLRDYINLMILGGSREEDLTTAKDALAVLARQKALDFAPGDEHSYSNSGYFLLSVIVERASGKSLADFARERLFVPLGMESTQFLDDHTQVIRRRASSYAPREEGGFAATLSDWEQTGDGAVLTTIEDLAKWDQNFYTPRVGGPALLAELQTKGTLNSGETIPYARGLLVDEQRGHRRVSHGGAWVGFRAQMMRFPDDRLTVITLCNLATADASALARKVADLYLPEAPQPAKPTVAPAPRAAAVALAPAELATYSGVFWNESTAFVRRLVVHDGKLFYFRGPGNETELVPLGDGHFAFADAPEFRLTVAAEAGGGRRLTLEGAGPAVELVEVEPAQPAAEELPAYAGSFWSEELDTTMRLSVAAGKLVIEDRRGKRIELEPLVWDTFSGRGLTLRFSRDAAGGVTGFALTVGRARNLGFTRAPAPR